MDKKKIMIASVAGGILLLGTLLLVFKDKIFKAKDTAPTGGGTPQTPVGSTEGGGGFMDKVNTVVDAATNYASTTTGGGGSATSNMPLDQFITMTNNAIKGASKDSTALMIYNASKNPTVAGVKYTLTGYPDPSTGRMLLKK